MRLSVSTAILTAFATSGMAVNIVLYPNSVSCNDNTGGLQCGNIAPGVCCHIGGRDAYSARFTGIDTTGVPDLGVFYQRNGGTFCASACNAGSGSSNFCLNPGTCPAGHGAEWFRLSRKREETEEDTKSDCIQPDTAIFANGRSFLINYDVPTNITILLIDLIKSDPKLEGGVPEIVLPYEVIAEEGA